MKRASRWLGHVVALIGSLVLVFLTLETGLHLLVPRSTVPTVSDPSIHRKLRPNMEISLKGADWESRVRTNEHGWMGKPFTVEKPEGITRILHIGDSLTEGMQVDTEENFVSQLNGKFPRAENLNLSISGRGTLLELLTYRYYGRSYDPDLSVLWFYTGNDLRDNYHTRNLVRTQSFDSLHIAPNGMGYARSFFFQRARLPRFVLEQGSKHAALTAFLTREPADNIPLDYTLSLMDTPERADAVAVTKQLFELLKKEVDKGKLAIAIIPSLPEVDEKSRVELLELYPGLKNQKLDFEFASKTVEQMARSLDIPVLNLTAAFRSAYANGETLFLPEDGHLNRAGHDFIAQTFAEWVQRQGLIRP